MAMASQRKVGKMVVAKLVVNEPWNQNVYYLEKWVEMDLTISFKSLNSRVNVGQFNFFSPDDRIIYFYWKPLAQIRKFKDKKVTDTLPLR